jgi:hypothetical protein
VVPYKKFVAYSLWEFSTTEIRRCEIGKVTHNKLQEYLEIIRPDFHVIDFPDLEDREKKSSSVVFDIHRSSKRLYPKSSWNTIKPLVKPKHTKDIPAYYAYKLGYSTLVYGGITPHPRRDVMEIVEYV